MMLNLIFWALVLFFAFLAFVRWFVGSGAIHRVDQWIHDFDRALEDLKRGGYEAVPRGRFAHWEVYKAARLRMQEYRKYR